MWLEQSKGVREKGKIENSAPPVGFKPTTLEFRQAHYHCAKEEVASGR